MKSVANSVASNRPGGTWSLRSRCGFIAVLAVAWLGSTHLPAQTAVAPSAAHAANRFLFIVETSRAMRSRAQGVFEAMKRALDSSLNGQIHQGDLVGIWTFNENVYQGLFPSQAWSQPTQLSFAVRLPVLNDPENYTKRARLEKVIPEMLKVISENANLTIVIVSSGEGVVQDIPFSGQISSAWKEWHDEQKDVHMPLLTALRTQNGQAVDWLLTPAPRPIALPPLSRDSRFAREKEPNSGVILESGLTENKSESAPLAPEQQVAFSVWALGRASLVNTLTNHPTVPARSENLAATQVANTPPIEQPAQTPDIRPAEPGSPTVAIAAPAPQQQTTAPLAPAPALGATSISEFHTSSNASLLAAVPAVDLSIDVAKSVHPPAATTPTPVTNTAHSLTSAPVSAVQRSHSSTPSLRHSEKSAESANLAIVSPPKPKDLSGQPMVAHARASNPEDDKRAQDSTAAVPQRNFLRDNLKHLALMLVAACGAAYSFKRWFLSQQRISRATTSLAQEYDDAPPEEEQTKRPIRPRAAA